MKVAVGLDLGGTSLKYGLVDAEGRTTGLRETPSRAQEGKRAIGETLRRAAREMLVLAKARRWRAVAVGAGVPGTVAGPMGTILMAPPQMPGTRGLQIGTLLAEASGLPVAVENDASAAGLAEARLGAGRGAANVLTVTVGTGLGGGVVIGGALVRGRFGTGGEIGHGIYDPCAIDAGRPLLSHLETFASATALVRLFRERGGDAAAGPKEIAAAARAGDRAALEAFEKVGGALGIGLATAANLVAPDVIAVGGGLAAAGRLLLDPTRRTFRAHALEFVAKGCRLTRARLGNRAGLIGAAMAAFDAARGARG